MRHIGIISVTLNAVVPLMATLAPAAGGESWIIRNYLDEGLQELVQREGGVTPKSVARLARLINTAIEDDSDVILLSCTVFSPYVETIEKLFSTPIVGADRAMLEQVARLGKKTAILCTFPASVESSEQMFRSATKKAGVDCDVNTFLIPEAAAALKSGDRQTHNRIVAERVRHFAQEYEVVVLAQISMASAIDLLLDCKIPVFTSPACAISALKNVLQ